MTELSSQTRTLLEIARSSDGPTETDRQRLANALATKVGIAAPVLLGGASVGALPHAGATVATGIATSSATAASGTSVGTLLSSAGVKVILAGLVGAAIGLATMAPIAMLTPDAAEAPPPEPLNPQPSPAHTVTKTATHSAGNGQPVSGVAGGIQPPSQSAAGGIRSPRESVAGSAPAAPIGVSPNPVAHSRAAASLTREAELLAAVQGELRANKPARALELLDEHERAYAGGALSEERQAARVLALCQAGQPQAARHQALEFLKAAPRSPLVPRIKRSCAFAVEDPAAPKPGTAERSPARQ